MGYGDELMASGMARGAKKRGKRIAFGDGQRIRWHPYAKIIFDGNPNVAPPGSENDRDIEWIENYAGKRPYNRQFGERWLWVPGFNNRPGEMFFKDEELAFAEKCGSGFVLIEPNVPAFKKVAPNKQWRVERFEAVAQRLSKDIEIAQFIYGPPHGPGYQISCARKISAPSFRHALAALARTALFIGPEGGLHHGAAAVGAPAVVLFGGFIAPAITGYLAHENLFTGGEPCGRHSRNCEHCRRALDAISIEMVMAAAQRQLAKRIAA